MKIERFIIVGQKNTYGTHYHIHDAFYRTLHMTGKKVIWTDRPEAREIDYSGAFVISEGILATHIPVSNEAFYAIHNLLQSPSEKRFKRAKNKFVHWGVYDNNSCEPARYTEDPIWIDSVSPFYLKKKHIYIPWATDLLPEEIEKNKEGAAWFRPNSRRINWVGSVWSNNRIEIGKFNRACRDNYVMFMVYGASEPPVSIENNIRLIRGSRFAPAIQGQWQVDTGYIPCRIFKNISYGAAAITNSFRVSKLFQHKVIFNNDAEEVFYEAERLAPQMPIEELTGLMDEVATKHTYINRIDALVKGAQMIMENR